MIYEPTCFSSVALQYSVKKTRYILSALIARELYLLYDSVLLGSLKYGSSTLPPNVVPFQVYLLQTLVGKDEVSDDRRTGLRYLVIAQVQLLQCCVMVEGSTKGGKTSVTQPDAVPLKAQLLDRGILLQELR